jgi:hypothetical protein
MKTNRRAPAGLAACIMLAFVVLPLVSPAREESEVRRAPAEPPKATNPHGFAGSAACSGRGCHGAIAPDASGPVARNEYSTWARYDKHATAFDALRSRRAKDMAANLAPTNADNDFKPIPADQDKRCLACHTTPEYATGTSAEMRDLQQQGIGCETCHGPALKGGDGWLTAHTTDDWKKLSSAEKEKRGMRVLGDFGVQAQVCVGCHVGAPAKDGLPARDLNHDLMAAGHPRLIFELSSYQANMPPHWRADKYKSDPGHEAKLWAVGRVEAARASLELLDFRLNDSDKWPEFAEAGCFACHASLRPENWDWRHRPGYRDPKVRGPGALPYNTWFSTGLPELAKGVGGAKDLDAGYAELATQFGQPPPGREGERRQRSALAFQAKETLGALAALGRAVDTATFDQGTVRGLMKELASIDEKRLAVLSWDEATQLVYSLAALYESSGMKRKDVTDQFAKVYAELAFPPGFESPAAFRISGATATSDQLTKELADLLKLLR